MGFDVEDYHPGEGRQSIPAKTYTQADAKIIAANGLCFICIAANYERGAA